jgi:hypothetical protein
MQAKRQTRYQLISYINSTMQYEDTTSESLAARTAMVTGLGSNPSELMDSSCVLLQAIIESILNAAAETEVPTSLLEGLLVVVDSCDQVSAGVSTSITSRNKLIRSSVNSLASESMVVGEKDKVFVDTYSRSTVSKKDVADTSEQVVPQTALEKLFSEPKSSLLIGGLRLAENSSDVFTRSVFLEESALNLHPNSSEDTSNPIKVEFFLSSPTAQDMPSGADSQYVLVTFQNKAPQEYTASSNNSDTGDNQTLQSGTRFVTDCASENITNSGSVTTINYTCPGGQKISHRCTGKPKVITSVGPAARSLPACLLLSSGENSPPSSCLLVSFTSSAVTCNCSISLRPSSSGTSSSMESSGYVEMVAMTEYVFEGFVSTNSEVTNLALGDVKQGTIVIVMFSVLWGCGVLGLYELMRASYCSCTSPVTPNPVKNRSKRTDTTREMTLEAKKEYLMKYIDDILPVAFRTSMKTDTTLQSTWKTIKAYHSYAVLFTAQGPGARETKIQKGLYLLTIQAMLMFIMSVFCDFQVLSQSASGFVCCVCCYVFSCGLFFFRHDDVLVSGGRRLLQHPHHSGAVRGPEVHVR